MYKILFVDDENAIDSIIDYGKDTFGYEIERFFSLEDAAANIGENFDLIVLDIMFVPENIEYPDGGLSFIEKDKIVNKYLKDGKIVLLSAANRNRIKAKVNELGIAHTHFIEKPVRMQEFWEKVNIILGVE